MKKTLLSLMLGACIGYTPSANAQNYEKMWSEAEKMIYKEDRPESAIEILKKIEKKAIDENNIQWLLKAFMSRTYTEFRKGADADTRGYISQLEEWKSKAEGTDKAVISWVLANSYIECMSRFGGKNTAIATTNSFNLPMEDWTTEQFYNKIAENIDCISQLMPEMMKKTTSDYGIITEQGELSTLADHSMAFLINEKTSTILAQFIFGSSATYEQTQIRDMIADTGTANLLKEGVSPASKYDFAATSINLYRQLISLYEKKDDSNGALATAMAFLTRTDAWQHMENYTEQLDVLAETWSGATKALPYLIYQKADRLSYTKEGKPQALEYAKNAIKKYPHAICINQLKNLVTRILQPEANILADKYIYPSVQDSITVSHRNTDGIKLRIYRKKDNIAAESINQNDNSGEMFGKHFTLYKTIDYKLKRPANYETADTTLLLPALPAGIWAIQATGMPDGKSSDYTYIVSTRFTHLYRQNQTGKKEIILLDSETGQPVEGASIEFLEYSRSTGLYKKTGRKTTTGKNGVFTCPDEENSSFLASKGQDNCYIATNNRWYSPGNYSSESKNISLFTDRGIYRPGQTIHLKGIMFRTDKNGNASVCKNEQGEVILRGSGNSAIDITRQFKTNEFGSFTADFEIPEKCLGGTYYIRTDYSSVSVRIEEYKRPSFEIELDKPEGEHIIGDSITVSGNATMFNGSAISNGRIRYEIERNAQRYFYMPSSAKRIIASGECSTDSEGRFRIGFTLEDDKNITGDNRLFRYTLKTYVTASNGETQEQSIVIPASDKPVFLSCSIERNTEKCNGLSLNPTVVNMNGVPVSNDVTYEVYEAGSKTAVLKGTVKSNTKSDIEINDLPSGKYRIVLEVPEKSVKSEYETIVYCNEDKTIPVASTLWAVQTNHVIDKDTPATFILGTSEDNEYIIMDICDESNVVETRILCMSNEMQQISIPYLEKYGNGLCINIATQRHGQLFTQTFRYTLREPDKKLEWKWNVFRDKLTPGQNETWELTLTRPDGTPANAELLAYMYDASLDKIAEQVTGNLEPNTYRYIYSTIWRTRQLYLRSLWLPFNTNYVKENHLDYDTFQPFMTYSLAGNYFFYSTGNAMTTPRMMMSKSAESAALASQDAVLEEAVVEETAAAPQVMEQTSDIQNIDVRSNFNETAFFYPQLRTDADGHIRIEFTLPESLTKWRFRGVSHTAEMQYCITDTTITASKDFMLVPDMPRFIRKGDRVSINATIVNNTDKQVKGKAVMEITDASTGKLLAKESTSFNADGNNSSAISFTFDAPDNTGVTICKIVAGNESFSDGEQRYLPILPDRTMIVDTKTEIVKENNCKIDISDMFYDKDMKDKSLTIEAAGNPAWFAVQALDYMANIEREDALSYATALYANAIGKSIISSNSDIQNAIMLWKNSPAEDILRSPLEKNEELKNITLSESPWMAEAQNDTKQKQRLARFLDTNNLNNSISYFTIELASLQNEDGGFSWFKGGYTNTYITQRIAVLLARMKHLAGNNTNSETERILDKAMGYLHHDMHSIYLQEIKDSDFASRPVGSHIINYLYICAISEATIPADMLEAYNRYLSKLGNELSFKLSVPEKAMCAIILSKAGQKSNAARFLKSLQEYEQADSFGNLYFPSASHTYIAGNNDSPVNIQSLVIEACSECGASEDETEALKSWLVTQKKSTHWGDPVASANAVHALTAYGNTNLSGNKNIKIRLGRKVIFDSSISKAQEAVTGYFKQTFTGKDADANRLYIEKEGNSQAWINVYARYDMPMEKVEEKGAGFSISKQMFVRRISNGQPVLIPVEETTPETGDLIVSRLVITNEQTTDFVAVKDMNPGCGEKTEQLSGYRNISGTRCYVENKDASTTYFFERLPEGRYVIENEFRLSRSGRYSSGIAVVQSVYAPEYSAHSTSETIDINNK